jgi:hypothetical protein
MPLLLLISQYPSPYAHGPGQAQGPGGRLEANSPELWYFGEAELKKV